jgi:hypothetical protein
VSFGFRASDLTGKNTWFPEDIQKIASITTNNGNVLEIFNHLSDSSRKRTADKWGSEIWLQHQSVFVDI